MYGQRGTNPLLSDSVETYFREGGSQVVTARVVGPGAVYASVNLLDSGSAASCTVKAIGPGAYANGYKIVVATVTGGYTITIEDSSSNVLEESNLLVTLSDAVNYGVTSSYVTITATGTNRPASGTFTLASGADDISSVTTTQYQAALALFTRDFGPGQVSVPGVTTSAVLTALAQHAQSLGRVAYGDLPDATSAATLEGDASPITALGVTARTCALWTPWVDIAPVAGSTGLRAVPPSAFAAGRAAANDAATGNPNLAAAGVRGILTTPVQLHATFSDADREALNTAGINVIRPMARSFRIYGNVTAVNRLADPLYFMLSNARLDMAIQAQANAIQEEYMFSQIDGAGNDAASFGNELVNMMTEWLTLGALFVGVNGTPAFTVDSGSDVNTSTTESQGELLATIAYVRSPGAEQVNLNIVRASVAQGL
ncbi:MAG: phage tail sheath subtilisin-like domain-containing protein [Mycobacteriaceae bacterium]